MEFSMAFPSTREGAFLQAVADVAYCNPFLPERIACERAALGSDFVTSEAFWNMRGNDPDTPHVNPLKIAARVAPLLEALRTRLADGVVTTEPVRTLYEDAVLFLLFYRYADPFYNVIVRAPESKPTPCRFYAEFLRDWAYYFEVPGCTFPTQQEAAHLFACFFQVRRAFHHIFRYIVGGSQAAARLRAAVWQSIFTHDMRRYRRFLYACIGDFTTLIMGPSGTGKELVARAIGLSRYVPFNPKGT
jgi:hypothetical protein